MKSELYRHLQLCVIQGKQNDLHTLAPDVFLNISIAGLGPKQAKKGRPNAVEPSVRSGFRRNRLISQGNFTKLER